MLRIVSTAFGLLWQVLYGFCKLCTVLDGSGLFKAVVVGSGPICEIPLEFWPDLNAALWLLPVLHGSCRFRIVVVALG